MHKPSSADLHWSESSKNCNANDRIVLTIYRCTEPRNRFNLDRGNERGDDGIGYVVDYLNGWFFAKVSNNNLKRGQNYIGLFLIRQF